MPDNLEKATFAEHLHTKFRVQLNQPESVELELVSISDGINTPVQESFALTFHGPALFLPQQNYIVEHERMGTFPLFLVPIAQNEDGFAYEAVFNRLRQ